MSRPTRLGPNLASLGNGLVGVGAIAYTFLGNKLIALLLIVVGTAFDSLDGFLARRSRLPPSSFGRFADSAADAVTFGIAPAVMVAFHSWNVNLWSPYSVATIAVAALVAVLAVARLTYFTIRGFQRPFFLGVPSPIMALTVVVLVLMADEPPFLGTMPELFLVAAGVAAVMMVVPLRYPKIRRGSVLRLPMAGTMAALSLAVVAVQFASVPDAPGFLVGFAASAVGAAGLFIYYLLGPMAVTRERLRPDAQVHA